MSISENKIKTLCGGKIVVIIPETQDQTVPLFCDLCLFPMKTLEDSLSYKKNKCCSICEMKWSKTIFGNWDEGWRPTKEVQGWNEYLEERKLLNRPVFNLR